MTGAISSCDKELYQYALNSLVLLISPLLMSVIIATIMGIPVNGVLIVIPFMTIRKYSGGFHSNRLITCTVESAVLLTAILYISTILQTGWTAYTILIISSIELCIFSPIKSKNKDINFREKTTNKKVVIIQTIIYSAISFILIHINMNRYAICIVCGIMLSSILQLPCIIKNVALYIKTVVSCKTYWNKENICYFNGIYSTKHFYSRYLICKN